MVKWFALITKVLFQIIGPPIFVIMIAAVLANILQTKPLFSSHPLKPDFTRMNPAQGLKKLFNRKTLFELFKTLLKVLVFGFITISGLLYFYPEIYQVSFSAKSSLDNNLVLSVILACGFFLAFLLPITYLDYLFSVKDFARQMRMSRREVKEEYKRNEGHPEIKSKRKQIQKELLRKASSLGKVKDADIIVTNPTHFSIALKYEPEKMAVPIVLAKGKDELAAQIRQLARVYGKPVLRRPQLARALYSDVEIDAPVPVSSYQTVAEVYRWLYQLRGVQA